MGSKKCYHIFGLQSSLNLFTFTAKTVQHTIIGYMIVNSIAVAQAEKHTTTQTLYV